MYAIIESGGKQYKVAQGDKVRVELLKAEEGEMLEITDVLAVSKDDSFTVGNPLVAGAVVKAKVLGHGKGKKVVIFKYKPKKNIRVKNGHRQPFTTLEIAEILA